MTTIHKDRIILGLETTTNICSAALWDGQQLLTEVTEAARSHSKTLLPMIERLLQQAQCTMSAVDFIACARGPGSFTGVRIGVGVAKGLAFGQDIAIIPVSPLQAIAYQVMQSEQANAVTAIIDARMGELYIADYQNQNGLPVLQGQERLGDIDSPHVGRQVFAGTGVDAYRQQLVDKKARLSAVTYPYAADVVKLAQQLPIPAVSAADFSPVYLRNKVVG